MKKEFLLFCACIAVQLTGIAQTAKDKYPVPEYSNEIYFLKKDSSMHLQRLEKGVSKMESKSKMGGMGGGENGYQLEGSRSTVRMPQLNDLSFVFYTGGSSSTTTPETDSIMKANGMDPSMQQQMGNPMEMMNDPSRTVSLYNMNAEKASRKITVLSYGGMKVFGKSKKESLKYTLSIKKVRDGYYELVVDKRLPKGEYAFVYTSMTNMDGSNLLFAFGVD